jgi:hypothetical protein
MSNSVKKFTVTHPRGMRPEVPHIGAGVPTPGVIAFPQHRRRAAP